MTPARAVAIVGTREKAIVAARGRARMIMPVAVDIVPPIVTPFFPHTLVAIVAALVAVFAAIIAMFVAVLGERSGGKG